MQHAPPGNSSRMQDLDRVKTVLLGIFLPELGPSYVMIVPLTHMQKRDRQSACVMQATQARTSLVRPVRQAPTRRTQGLARVCSVERANSPLRLARSSVLTAPATRFRLRVPQCVTATRDSQVNARRTRSLMCFVSLCFLVTLFCFALLRLLSSYLLRSTGEHECTACDAGKYKSSSGSALCAECEAGKFSSSSAAEQCEDCAVNSDSVAGSTVCSCVDGFTGTDSCSACAAGKYKASQGSESCSNCEPGKFAAQTGSTTCDDCTADADSLAGSVDCFCNAGFTGSGDSCTSCAAGKYKASGGSEECSACAAGKYSLEAGAVECIACEKNSYSISGSIKCLCNAGFSGALCAACPEGTFKAAAGETECVDCAAGKYSDSMSATSCDQCHANSNSVEGSSSCVCVAGYSGGVSCSACSAGTYKALSGQEECTSCPAGTYQDQQAAVSCEDCKANSDSEEGATRCMCDPGYTGENCSPCAPGSYKEVNGGEPCLECEAGKYSDDTGAIDCTECAQHATSSKGSTSCACLPGYNGDGHICAVCIPGKFKASIGSSDCRDCGAGKYSEAVAAQDESSCVDCPAGKYSAVVGAYAEGVCLDCPAGTYHAEGAGGATSADVCTACEAGKFSSIQGATDESACIGCAGDASICLLDAIVLQKSATLHSPRYSLQPQILSP